MAEPNPRILITGAAGNLGSLLARHLAARGQRLRLMYHRKPLAADVASRPNVEAVQADLARLETLPAAVAGVDVAIHFAGVLFRPRPKRFLPETNVRWFANRRLRYAAGSAPEGAPVGGSPKGARPPA